MRALPILLILPLLSAVPAKAETQTHTDHAHQNHIARQMSVTIEHPQKSLSAGYENQITFTLKDESGSPITPDDLNVVHTKKLHILAINPAMDDYHHIHPEVTKTLGTYTFMFAPETTGPYRMFIEGQDHKTGTNMSARFQVGSGVFTTTPLAARTTPRAVVGDYDFYLMTENDKPAKANTPTTLSIRVMNAKSGEPAKNLAPIMGAFAHLVGFTADGENMLHLHPTGQEPDKDSERGGPVLTFAFTPKKAGPTPLFLQVHINNETLTVPFTLNIAP